MTTKQTKRWLMICTAALALAGPVVFACCLFIPVSLSAPESKEQDGLSTSDDSSTDHMRGRGPTLQQLNVFKTADLRRPLKDPPPVQIKPPPMQAKLLGTIYEPDNPGQSQALFRLADGAERFFKAGQQFSEPGGVVDIKRVDDQSVLIEYQKEQRELKVGSP